MTGLRTNAEYHLGNYLGAILPMVHMANSKADEYQINLFAPDLHSFTTPIDHKTFYKQTMDNIRLFAASGIPIDHDNVFMYRQSRIPAHSELTWILGNFTGFGEMARMVEFKEKSQRTYESLGAQDSVDPDEAKMQKTHDRVSVGLFTYPILMAADILLYGAEWVPVGEDQRQHLEFARDISTRFNNQFGDTFVVPKAITEQQKFVDRDSAPRIRSLRDPSKKMSKSVSDPAGTIQLSDTPEEATKKIMSATTDSVGKINFDFENQPGISNLLQILGLLSGKTQQEINDQWTGNERYGDLKKATAEAVAETLQTIQGKLSEIDEQAIATKLESSETAMTVIANETLLKVQKAVGLR